MGFEPITFCFHDSKLNICCTHLKSGFVDFSAKTENLQASGFYSLGLPYDNLTASFWTDSICCQLRLKFSFSLTLYLYYTRKFTLFQIYWFCILRSCRSSFRMILALPTGSRLRSKLIRFSMLMILIFIQITLFHFVWTWQWDLNPYKSSHFRDLLSLGIWVFCQFKLYHVMVVHLGFEPRLKRVWAVLLCQLG